MADSQGSEDAQTVGGNQVATPFMGAIKRKDGLIVAVLTPNGWTPAKIAPVKPWSHKAGNDLPTEGLKPTQSNSEAHKPADTKEMEEKT